MKTRIIKQGKKAMKGEKCFWIFWWYVDIILPYSALWRYYVVVSCREYVATLLLTDMLQYPTSRRYYAVLSYFTHTYIYHAVLFYFMQRICCTILFHIKNVLLPYFMWVCCITLPHIDITLYYPTLLDIIWYYHII